MPSPLIAPEELAERLSDPRVRVFDCRLARVAQPSGPSLWSSGEPDWRRERIPGARFLHMLDDLSDPDAPVPYTPPPPEALARSLAALGADLSIDLLVTYGEGADMAAHRAWWTLAQAGAEARTLDGGLAAWRAEGLPLDATPPSPPVPVPAPTTLPRPRRTLIATRDEVEAARNDTRTSLLNALPPELFRGEGDQVFGRRGRIAGSRSLPATEVIDPDTGRFRDPETIRRRLAEAAPGTDRAITYCGGGIAASTLLVALLHAGIEDAALYDGSLLEWGADPASAMETGP